MFRFNYSKFYSHFTKSISYDSNNIYFRPSEPINRNHIFSLTRLIQEKNNKSNIKNLNPIKLHITSRGGDAELGLMAYDLLKQSKIPIYTYCEGYVYSAATFIYLAGTKRFITPNSTFLIHQINFEHCGKYNDLIDIHQNTTIIMKNMENLYLKETKIDKKTLKKFFTRDITLSSDDCIKLGISNKKIYN